jgi:hypothetical protein
MKRYDFHKSIICEGNCEMYPDKTGDYVDHCEHIEVVRRMANAIRAMRNCGSCKHQGVKSAWCLDCGDHDNWKMSDNMKEKIREANND